MAEEITKSEARKLADQIVIMADEYGRLGERYNELNKIYALQWEGFRKDYKSDKSCEKSWELTLEGLEMAEINLKMKVKEKKISAYKKFIDVINCESRNQY